MGPRPRGEPPASGGSTSVRPSAPGRPLVGTLLVAALVAVLLSLLPTRLFLGKSYVTLTYTLAESAGTLGTVDVPRLRDAEARLERGLRGRADVALDAREGALVVEVDDTRRERAKRGIQRRLPELTLVDERPAVRTSIVTFALPVLVSLLWLAFVRRFDRAHPEPWLLVLLAFGGGLLAAWCAGAVQWVVAAQFPAVPDALQRLAEAEVPTGAWWRGAVVAFLYAGVLEESVKLAAFALTVARRREFDEPVDGIVYAAAIALGFAAAENVRYFADGNLAPALVVGRTFVAVPTHVFLSSLWGRRLGERLVDPRARVWPALVLAMALHAGFDLLSITARGPSSFVLPIAVACLSLLLFAGLQSTLRFGSARHKATARASLDGSERFRTGSRRRFGLLLTAFFLCAFALVVLASLFQTLHPTALTPMALSATACALLLALFGYLVTESLPLDVELDRHGLRFAGQSYTWHDLEGEVEGYRKGLLIVGRGRPLYLGPLAEADRERLRSAITQHTEDAPPPSSVLA